MTRGRARLRRRWSWFVAGSLAGLLIAAFCCVAWSRAYSQPAILLLGSGRGLSALVVSDGARVLIVNGNDPTALTNALTEARPPTMRRIDVLVIAPGATTALIERAAALAAPRRVMAIAGPELDPPSRVGGQAVRDISAPRTIRLANDLLIDIDPGLIAGQPEQGWIIRVSIGGAVVTLSERTPHRPGPDVLTHVIIGDVVSEAAAGLTKPLFVAAGARFGAGVPDHGVNIIAINAGEWRRLLLRGNTIAIEF